MDESAFEQAQRVTENAREAAIDAARTVPKETPLERDGVRYCLDCDDPIDARRLSANAGAVRCIWCQEDHDKAQRRFACT